MVMKTKLLEIIALIATCVLLCSCATNSALSLIEASKSSDPVIPSKNVVTQELKGQAFKLGEIEFAHDAFIENMADLPDAAYPVLLRTQLQKAFLSAALNQGKQPVYSVDLVINQLKFTKDAFLIPVPSILHVTMEVSRPDSTKIMRGEFESRYVPTIPVIVPGVVVILPTGFAGQEWESLRKIIPAMAIAITRTIKGLQGGKGLDEIEIYPEDLQAGGVIMPDSFLRGRPYGLSELTSDDISALAKTDVQGHDQYNLKMSTCQSGDFLSGWQFERYQEKEIPPVIPYKKNAAAYLGAYFEGSPGAGISGGACHLSIYDSVETAIDAIKWHKQVGFKGVTIRNISVGDKAFYSYSHLPILFDDSILKDPVHYYSMCLRRGRAVMYISLHFSSPSALSDEELYEMVEKIDSRVKSRW